jgi:pyruvate dehydrogenase E2 component (dihydrolipoamide acetyltransferase)
MATAIIMPKFGQMTEESTILEWFKREGDAVAKGDTLFTVETDKSVMEVESFEAGTLLKIAVLAGASVPVQSVVGYLGAPGDELPQAPTPEATPQPTKQTPAALVPATATSLPLRISPRAAALARNNAVDVSAIKGSGPQGRIVEKDVRDHLAARGAPRREEPMSKMRQIIAQRLAQSMATAPHFYVTVEVDMTELIAHRARLVPGARPSLTDYVALAAVATLTEFPDLNSSTDGSTIRRNDRVHLGLAVALEQGLVVPVIRDADTLSFAALALRSAELISQARAGALTPDQMSGSTFTISNMGMLDVENFTAIINPGESAILAISSAIKKPVVRDDQVTIRAMMKLTLSSDHRLIDGATAARFLNALKRKLEDVTWWTRQAS